MKAKEINPKTFDLIAELKPGFPKQQYTKPVLFLCHTLQADVILDYQILAQHWHFKLPILGIQPPGLVGQAMPDSIESLASEYVAAIRTIQPTGPYLLAAWSLGGSIIHAMANQLRHQQQKVFVIGLDTVFVPHLNQQPKEAFVQFMYQYLEHEYQLKLTPEQLSELAKLDKPKQIEQIFARLAQHLNDTSLSKKAELQQQLIQMSLTYAPVYHGQLDLIATAASQQQHHSRTLGWPEVFVKNLVEREGDDHFSLLLGNSDDHRSVAWLAEQLHQISNQHLIEHQQNKHFQLPPTLPNFTGRAKQLNDLNEKLNKPTVISSDKKQRVTGTGGVGKTQLAIAFCHNMIRQGLVSRVIWLHAGGDTLQQVNENLLNQFYQLGERFGFSRDSYTGLEIVAAVYKQLAKEPNVLVVFDDAISPEAIHAFMPTESQPCKTLITTRDSNAWDQQHFDNVTLDVFSEKDAYDYVVKVLTNEAKYQILTQGEPLIGTLCKELGCFPLALTQAVYYIVETGISIEAYLKRYEEYASTLLDRIDFNNPHEQSLWLTLKLCLDKIDDHATQETLTRCCFYAPEYGIPKGLAQQCSTEPDKIENAIYTLQRFSLFEAAHHSDSVKMHKMTQDVLLKLRKFDSAELAKQQCRAAQTLEQYLVKSESLLPIEYEHVQDVTIPHLQHCTIGLPVEEHTLLSQLGLHHARYYSRHGEFERSSNACRYVDEHIEPSSFAENALLLEAFYIDCHNKLATGYTASSLRELRRAFFERTGIELRTSMLPPHQQLKHRILNFLIDNEGPAHTTAASYKAMAGAMLQSYSMHPDLRYLMHIATFLLEYVRKLHYVGDTQLAVTQMLTIMHMLLGIYAPDYKHNNPDIVGPNRAEDIIKPFQPIIDMINSQSELLKHPILCEAINLYAELLGEMGLYEQMCHLLVNNVQRLEGYYGLNHIQVIATSSLLAYAKIRQGHVFEALTLAEKNMLILKQDHGGKHFLLLLLLTQVMAEAQEILGDPRALSTAVLTRKLAENCEKRGYQVPRKQWIRIHTLQASSNDDYEVELERQFRVASTIFAGKTAQTVLRDILLKQLRFYLQTANVSKLRNKTLVFNGSYLMLSSSDLNAYTEYFCQQAELAFKVHGVDKHKQTTLQGICTELRGKYGNTCFQLLKPLNILANYDSQSDPDRELDTRLEILEIVQAVLPAEHLAISKCHINIALTYARAGIYEFMLDSLQWALEIIINNQQRNPHYRATLDLFIVHYCLAIAHHHCQNPIQAKAFAEKAKAGNPCFSSLDLVLTQIISQQQDLDLNDISPNVLSSFYFDLFSYLNEYPGMPLQKAPMNSAMRVFEQGWPGSADRLAAERYVTDIRQAEQHATLLSQQLCQQFNLPSAQRISEILELESSSGAFIKRVLAGSEHLSPQNLLSLCKTLMKLKLTYAAHQLLEHTLAFEQNQGLLEAAAQCDMLLGNYEQASERLMQCFDFDSDSTRTTLFIQKIADIQEEISSESQQNRAQLSFSPRSQQALARAIQLRKLYQYPAALQLLETVASSDEPALRAAAHYQQAKCFYALGRNELAYSHILKASEVVENKKHIELTMKIMCTRTIKPLIEQLFQHLGLAQGVTLNN